VKVLAVLKAYRKNILLCNTSRQAQAETPEASDKIMSTALLGFPGLRAGFSFKNRIIMSIPLENEAVESSRIGLWLGSGGAACAFFVRFKVFAERKLPLSFLNNPISPYVTTSPYYY